MKKHIITLTIILFTYFPSTPCSGEIDQNTNAILSQIRECQTAAMKYKYTQRENKIVKVDNKKYEKRTEQANIKMYYRDFDRYGNDINLHHYKIGEYIKPEGQFIEIAKITTFRGNKDDQLALQELTSMASELGGDAIFDVYRNPIIGGIREDEYGKSGLLSFSKTDLKDNAVWEDVAAYEYKCKVIRFRREGDIKGFGGVNKVDRNKQLSSRRGRR